jgi:hypothetical protein
VRALALIPIAAILAVALSAGPVDAQDFIRGNSNADAAVDIGDAIFTLAYLFSSGPPPPCLDAADANDDGAVDIGDPVLVLDYLFGGLAALPPPFPAAGPDPTADALSCSGGCSDIWYMDFDGDGFGDSSAFIVACGPSGLFTATVGGDCSDGDPDIHPNAVETCNLIDDNCDQVHDNVPPEPVPHGMIICTPNGPVLQCDSGWFDGNGDPVDGCECSTALPNCDSCVGGTFTLDAPIVYSCGTLAPFLDISISSLVITDTGGTNFTVEDPGGDMPTLLGICGGSALDASGFVPGGCAQTWTFAITFDSPTSFTGTLTLTLLPVSACDFIGCTSQTWPISGQL